MKPLPPTTTWHAGFPPEAAANYRKCLAYFDQCDEATPATVTSRGPLPHTFSIPRGRGTRKPCMHVETKQTYPDCKAAAEAIGAPYSTVAKAARLGAKTIYGTFVQIGRGLAAERRSA